MDTVSLSRYRTNIVWKLIYSEVVQSSTGFEISEEVLLRREIFDQAVVTIRPQGLLQALTALHLIPRH
jgi:hypothetical protein